MQKVVPLNFGFDHSKWQWDTVSPSKLSKSRINSRINKSTCTILGQNKQIMSTWELNYDLIMSLWLRFFINLQWILIATFILVSHSIGYMVGKREWFIIIFPFSVTTSSGCLVAFESFFPFLVVVYESFNMSNTFLLMQTSKIISATAVMIYFIWALLFWQMVYVLSVYNKKEKHQRMTVCTFEFQWYSYICLVLLA